MASSDDDVQVKFGAKIDQALEGLRQMSDAVRTHTEGWEGRLKSLTKTIEGVKAPLIALTAVITGEKIFEHAIQQTREWELSAMSMSRQLGVNTQESIALKGALEAVGSTTEAYLGTWTMFTRQLRTHQEMLKSLGVDVEAFRKGQKSSQEMFLEALEITKQYKAGFDMAEVSMALFGRRISNVYELQKLSNEGIKEANDMMTSLGLTVTKYNVETSREFGKSTHEIELIFKAMGKTIGDYLMPILNQFMHWFAVAAPLGLQIFRGVLASVLTMVNGAILGFQLIVIAVKNFFDVSIPIGERAKNAFKEMTDAADKTKTRLTEMWTDVMNSGAGAPATPPGGDKQAPYTGPSRVSLWAAELSDYKTSEAKKLAAQGQFQEMSKQSEITWWREKLMLAQKGNGETREITQKINDLELAGMKQKFESDMTIRKRSSDLLKADYDQRITLQQKIYEDTKQAYGADHEKTAAEYAKLLKLWQDYLEQKYQLALLDIARTRDAQLGVLNIEKSQLEQELALRQINQAQMLRIEQQLEDRRFAIQRDTVNKEKEAWANSPTKDPAKLAQLNAQMEQVERDHAEKTQDINKRTAEQMSRTYVQARDAIQSSFGDLFYNLIDGVDTVKQAFVKFEIAVLRAMERIIAQRFAERMFGPGTVGGAFIDKLIKPIIDGFEWILTEWLGMESAKTAATEGAAAVRTSTEAAAAVEGVVSAKIAAAEEISAWAAVAAVAAMASVAEIPYVGWIMAPGVGVEQYATGMSYLSMLALDTGTNYVPQDMIAQIHEGEAVVPKEFNPAAGGGGLTASGGDTHLHFHGPVWDHDKFGRYLMKTLKDRARSFDSSYMGMGG